MPRLFRSLALAAFAATALAGAAEASQKTTVHNNTDRSVRVYFTAAGCFGAKNGLIAICSDQSVAAGKSVSYTYKLGTSARRVNVADPLCSKGESNFRNIPATASVNYSKCDR